MRSKQRLRETSRQAGTLRGRETRRQTGAMKLEQSGKRARELAGSVKAIGAHSKEAFTHVSRLSREVWECEQGRSLLGSG